MGAIYSGVCDNENMFYVVLYFLVAYSFVAFLMFAVSRMQSARKMSRSNRLLVFAVLANLPLVPYLKVAVQTQLYASQLLPAVKASEEIWGWPNKPYSVVRVINILPSNAEVYVLTQCNDGYAGMIVKLKNADSIWAFDTYDAVFSDCGSAEGNTFPPYPEARSF